jgi:ABC-type uncharacterized transport system YnjBCD ATPase subunit
MDLNKDQVNKLSDFLIDLAKIIFASTALGFLFPGSSGKATIIAFLAGILISMFCLVGGLKLLTIKTQQ